MALPSYFEISEAVEVPRCRGIQNGFRCYYDHDNGEIRDGFIHWADRRVLREGIYNFLKLAATFTVTRDTDLTDWRLRYQILREIPGMAKTIHVQLPRSLGANDRAELAAILIKLPAAPDRTEALEWARR